MPKYLMHRICFNSDVSYPLLEKGWLSIGYVDANIFAESKRLDLIGLSKQCTVECGGIPESCPHHTTSGEQVYDILEQTYNWKPGTLIPRTRGLVSFLSLEPNDIVLVPHSSDGTGTWGGGFTFFEVVDTPISVLKPTAHLVNSTASFCKFGQYGIIDLSQDDNDKDAYDVGFVIEVRPLCPNNLNIDRLDASEELRRRMNNPQTNIFCHDFKKEIDELIKTH